MSLRPEFRCDSFSTRTGHIDRTGQRIEISCFGHDRSETPELTSLLRSDTPMEHQTDTRYRSKLFPKRGQNDDTNRMDFAARTASVDVTGAVWDCALCRSGRSHSNRIGHQFAMFCLSDRTVDRIRNSDSGHALLCGLKRSRFAPSSPSSSLLRHRKCVIVLTAQSDSCSNHRTSGVRCIGRSDESKHGLVSRRWSAWRFVGCTQVIWPFVKTFSFEDSPVL